MRVTYVIDSLGQGGAEKSLIETAGALRNHGVTSRLVVLDERWDLLPDAERAGLHVQRIAGRSSTAAIRALAGNLRADPPDLVHTSLYRANVVGRCAARIAGVPAVSSLVNTPYGPSHLTEPGLSAFKVRSAQAVDITTCRLVRRFHAVADHVADTMARRLWISRDRIDVIPRGRSREDLGERTAQRRERVRRGLGVGAGPLALTVARSEHQKGLDVLIDAAMALPEFTFLVAGREGNASDDLKAKVANADLTARVRFLGFRDDVPDLLVAADVMVLPSRREGLPGVVLEAMALECPVVATRLPGTVEALGEDHPWLVPADDSSALAEAIREKTATMGERSSEVATARRRFDERFSLDAVAGRMLCLYERVLDST